MPFCSPGQACLPVQAKHAALQNVATSYTLDHVEETALFAELGAIIRAIQDAVRLRFKAS